MAISGPAIEALFDFMTMSKGFIVSKPRCDTAQYDRIVDTKNQLHRVQIKGRRGKGRRSIVIRVGKTGDKKYTKEDTDIIALYIEDNNSWYLIPVEKCSDAFRLNVVKDKLDIFKNNWSIFT